MATKKSTAAAPTILEFVSLPEAAKIANVSERHMRLLVEKGQVPATKIGRNYVVLKAAAAAFQRHPSKGRPRGG